MIDIISKDIIDILNKIIDDKDVSISSVARRLNKSSQALNKQLKNDDIKLSTLLEIINALHCDVSINIIDRATKKDYKIQGKLL